MKRLSHSSGLLCRSFPPVAQLPAAIRLSPYLTGSFETVCPAGAFAAAGCPLAGDDLSYHQDITRGERDGFVTANTLDELVALLQNRQTAS